MRSSTIHPSADELLRVVIHGLLHCCSFDDQTEKQSKVMRKMEAEALKLFLRNLIGFT